MSNASLDEVILDYTKLIKMAKIFERIGLSGLSLKCVHVAAFLMYNFNIIYHDDRLEQILKNSADNLLAGFRRKVFLPESLSEEKLVFYDFFSIDNRGLTEQYLRAVLEIGYDVLYISCQTDKAIMKNILKLLADYPRSKVFFVSPQPTCKILSDLLSVIYDFGASRMLIHSAPWDVFGAIVWYCVPQMTKYMINITDHAFWLGVGMIDYVIEFRSYGYNITKSYRGIDASRCKLQPYYPIKSTYDPFEGFPFDAENKKIIFSGGAIYKITGSEVFFDLIKYVLNTSEDTVFWYVGNGDCKKIKEFIKLNNYEERFFYSKERRDINEIFKRCYLYLGTYPIPGGLMSQLAVENNKLVLSYRDEDLPINNINEFFINREVEISYTNLDMLKEMIKKILLSEVFLKEQEQKLSQMVITPECFKENLSCILSRNSSKFTFVEYDVDIRRVQEVFLLQERQVMGKYNEYFCFGRHYIVVMAFPLKAIKALFSVLKRYVCK